MQIKKRKVVKFGNGYAMLIPIAYIRDGNILTDKEYDIKLMESITDESAEMLLDSKRKALNARSEICSRNTNFLESPYLRLGILSDMTY